MLRNKGNPQIIALAIPILGLLLWTVSVAWNHGSGETGRVRIVGYDPIDLLSGHYLRFRYDFQNPALCSAQITNKSPEICACLDDDSSGALKALGSMACLTAQQSCPKFVRGSCEYGNFLTGSERFYFPEAYASVLAVVPPDSFAEIKLNSSGRVALQNIFVGTQPILEYAKLRLEGGKP